MQLYIQNLSPAIEGQSRAERERSAVMSLLRAAIGSDVEYSHTPAGAPIVKNAGREYLVSITNCRNTAAIAVADDEIALGIDIEDVREQLTRIKERFLTEAELRIFTDLPALLRAWTAKEAVYKAALTPGLAMHEIDLTRLDAGIATARGISYTVSFPLATPTRALAAASRKIPGSGIKL